MIVKKTFTSIIIVVISVIAGSLLLFGSYHLPTDRMVNNIKKAVPIYQQEGLYPKWTGKNESSQLDNWTDALMLLTAIYPNSKSPYKDAMLNPKHDNESNPVESLLKELKGVKSNATSIYPRYWHGYLVFLKPLTMAFDISYIRLLNMLMQMLLAAYLIACIGCHIGKGFGLSIFLSYLLLNPVSLAMSFQFSTMFYITSFISVLLLNNVDYLSKTGNAFYLFLISGILTAFFDLLTYPIVSLAIPLILFLLVFGLDNKFSKLFDAIQNIIGSSIFWGIGYGGMYIGKWLMVWQLTGYNAVTDAFSQLVYRMSHHTAAYEGKLLISPIKAISRNFQVILHEPTIVILVIILIISLWQLFKLSKSSKLHNYSILKCALGTVAMYPIVWYIVFCNHSYVHFWFTYRALSVVVFAVGSIIATTFLEYQEKKFHILP